MATNFEISIFADVPVTAMVARLFGASPPAFEPSNQAICAMLDHDVLIYLSAPHETSAFGVTPTGEQWERRGHMTVVSLSVDDEAPFDLQELQAEALTQRLLDTGIEDIALTYEECLYLRRTGGAVERFEWPRADD